MSLVGGWDSDNNVNRLFEDLVKDLSVARRSGTRPGRVNTWSPTLDVHETEKEFLVNTELPGLTKEQINIDVHDNTLVISGESKQDEKYKEGNVHIQERRYGTFNRSISLPPNVKPEDISAKFENGLLELKLPKTANSGRKITIQ